eukprot:1195894-Prorocentrum_minimum.AAC.4
MTSVHWDRQGVKAASLFATFVAISDQRLNISIFSKFFVQLPVRHSTFRDQAQRRPSSRVASRTYFRSQKRDPALRIWVACLSNTQAQESSFEPVLA